jgi:DNA (cytosine-5)-methyltransferase 1
MKLLDLFCGAGGAAMGYYRAGFTEIVGVDNRPQPRYPFKFVQADALRPPFRLEEFDAIHASPPCQAYTVARNIKKREHPRLVEAVRAMLESSGLPFVIENVNGSPLIFPMRLCGTSFGLGVQVRGIDYELRRHRFFEVRPALGITPPCQHEKPVIGVYGHGESKAMRGKRGYQISQVEHRRTVMQMPWANRDEIAEAIPPAYTEFIGRQLLAALSERVA